MPYKDRNYNRAPSRKVTELLKNRLIEEEPSSRFVIRPNHLTKKYEVWDMGENKSIGSRNTEREAKELRQVTLREHCLK